MLHAFKTCYTSSFYAFQRFFATFIVICRDFISFLARETKIMYSIFFYLILLSSVITMFINFILDVELS